MNYIDYIIIILLLISAISGLVKGFIYEIVSLIALILGVWGAIHFSGMTRDFLVDKLSLSFQHIDIAAFILTFIAIIIFIHFLGKAVHKAVESVSLGAINRLAGMVFAVFKTAFIIGIILIVIERLDEESQLVPQTDVNNSALYTPLRNVALSTFPFLQGLYNNIVIEEQEKKNRRQERRASRNIA